MPAFLRVFTRFRLARQIAVVIPIFPFTPEGILKLEREGIAKRSETSAGIPNLNKLAQVLRMLGEYLETKSGRLLKASKRQDQLSFEYATGSSNLVKEEWKLSDLYEFWLEMSTQREERRNILEAR